MQAKTKIDNSSVRDDGKMDINDILYDSFFKHLSGLGTLLHYRPRLGRGPSAGVRPLRVIPFSGAFITIPGGRSLRLVKK